jgi:hypothetical protein
MVGAASEFSSVIREERAGLWKLLGNWGITYCLRLTGLPEFSRVTFF